jgi:hypothetical protein
MLKPTLINDSLLQDFDHYYLILVFLINLKILTLNLVIALKIKKYFINLFNIKYDNKYLVFSYLI